MGRNKTPENKFIKVAVMAGVRDALTYQAPPKTDVWPGQRVLVPIAARKAIGVAIEPAPAPAPGVTARAILRVLDAEPLLSPELLTLGLWIAEYYHAPVGEVFRGMLPIGQETHRIRLASLAEAGRARRAELAASLLAEAREGDEAAFLDYLANHDGVSLASLRRRPGGQMLLDQARKKHWIEIREEERGRRSVLAVTLGGEDNPEDAKQRVSSAARRIIDALREQGAARDHRDLLKSTRTTLATLRKMQQRGLIVAADARTAQFPSSAAPIENSLPGPESPLPISLTTGQSTALRSLEEKAASGSFCVFLLHGVTGSGKTEIYLRLVSQCLDRGKSALLLVPEIALTPMAQSIFLARFGGRLALLHSGLSDAERQAEWWRVWRQEARVVLGTRSAVFAPLSNLGLVVVDEEHDASYKQQETPRYHGRDVAVVRARLAGAMALLGSATPSLESYWNAQQGKYQLLTLAERVQGRPLASVEVIDMREEFRETHTQALISRRLRQEIQGQIQSGNQTMILLNHRGYSWFLLCRSCGEAINCANCSISLTYHRREHRLMCHYCGYSTPVPERCPICGGEYLHYVGEGTEKIADKLAEMFPSARVARLDRDAARRPGDYLRILTEFRRGEIQILAGTQMIAKGHDFPGVTLVGIVSADMGLRLPDFRSAEHVFQLLTQAAGRAGRGDAPGRVLVQTFYPGHYAIRFAADQNYAGFFSKEMGFRRLMHYPPVMALANIIAQDEKLEKAAEIAHGLGECLRRTADPRHILMLGPNPAPVAKIDRRYRIQILLKASSRPHLNQALRQLVDECHERRFPPRAVIIDVDPVSMM